MITVDQASIRIVEFVQADIADLVSRWDKVRRFPLARYDELVTIRLYGTTAVARCLIRKQTTLLIEVDPLTTEDIRHYFKLYRRNDGWRLRGKVVVVRGTQGLTPYQRIPLVKDLLK